MVKMNNIIREYIDKYGIRDNESEEKRVRNLVSKIHETKSVFSNFPFDYMVKEEQLTLLNFIMTSLPERQIMANMKKTDVDRCYMNFVYRNDDILNNEMFKAEFDGYSPIDLSNEIIQSRYIIRFSPESEKKILEDLLQMNENILELYYRERALFKMLGLQIDNEQYIKEYIDYVANVILQFMVYKIIRNCNIEDKVAIKKISDKIKELNIPVFDMDLEEYQEFCLDEYEQDISKFEYITDVYGNFVNKRNEYEQFCTDLRKLINDGSADELALTFETLIYKVYSELSDYYIDTYWYAPDSEVISLMYSDHNDQEQCYAMDSATLLFKNNDVILDDTYELIIQNISNFIVETNNLTKVLKTIKKNKLKEIRKFKV